MCEVRDPARFWEKLMPLPTIKSVVPAKANRPLETARPIEKLKRLSGLGRLGRKRFVAPGEWDVRFVAREAKAFAGKRTIARTTKKL
jgi:hypothetical protein